MARLRDIVLDCRHPASLARFWAAAMNGYAVAPYDEEELARLRTMGVLDPEEDPQVMVEGPPGSPSFFFQRVPEPKAVKNRMHVDLVGDGAELQRLLALGASVVARHPELVVLADPEGNEFCLIDDWVRPVQGPGRRWSSVIWASLGRSKAWTTARARVAGWIHDAGS